MDPRNDIPLSYTRNFLPSKKTLAAAGIVLAACLLYWAYPHIKGALRLGERAKFSLSTTPREPLLSSGQAAPTLSKDTDGDGIPDWQEALFGFDPEKIDTDGDGEPDKLPTVNGTPLGDALELSDTNKLALTVYSAFQNIEADSIDPAQVEQIAGQEVLDHALAIEESFKKYGVIDITLGPSETADIVSYGNQIVALTDEPGDPIIFAKDIQEKILEQKDPSREIKILNSIMSKLLTMTVPARISDLHLSLTNGIYYIIQALEIENTDDELNTYVKSLIAQKNINLLQQTVFDITTLQGVYQANQP